MKHTLFRGQSSFWGCRASSLLLASACAAVWPMTVAAQPVELPIVQRKYEHEAVQYDYRPWYIPNVPAFDQFNRPYLRTRGVDPHTTGAVQTLRDGQWVQMDFTPAIRAAYPGFVRYRHAGGTLGAGITFDADDDLYTILRILLDDKTERDLLLYSADYGQNFQVIELPTDRDPLARPTGSANMEQRVGHNVLDRPPLITTLVKRADHPHGQWTAHYNMSLFQPRKEGGRLVLGEPTLLTDRGLYMSRHAGNPSFAVSGPEKTFVVWAETTDHPYYIGSPTFVATFDPKTGEVTDKQFCGYGYPVNNGHNSPGVVLDHEGYIHVLTGSHGENFMYSRSNEPFSTAAGVTVPEPSLKTGWKEFGLERGRQCYLSFVAGRDGTLHIAYRQWYQDTEPYHLETYFGGLSHLRKAPGQPWEERSQLVMVPPYDDYAIFYQNLATDRDGRIFLSYGYRTPYAEYGTGEAQNHYTALLMTEDGGASWRLMRTEDFVERMHADAPAADRQVVPGTLSGQVIDAAGAPVAGAKVQALFQSVTTDARGHFEVPGVLARQVPLVISHEGFQAIEQRVDRDAAGQRFTLQVPTAAP